jgi:hypothetical protein
MTIFPPLTTPYSSNERESMTTKPPSEVEPAPEDSLEKIAHGSVEGIPAADPHELDRLGYSIFLWLKFQRDPLEIAVRTTRARLLISEEEAVERITAKLRSHGIDV